MASIGQINVNRSRPAQDLIARVCVEERLGLVAVSEPHSIRGGCWLFSLDVPPMTALAWQYSNVPCSPLFTGEGFVAVEWGELVVFSCYFSPNLPDAEFGRGLCDLGARVQSCDRRPLLVLGDFNARSPAWDRGEPNRRGRTLARWAAGLDMILLNEGFVPTCVHPRGVSCVDLSWTSASAARHICNWRVAVDTESLSDHRYVFMEVLERIVGPLRRVATEKHFPRWCVRRINVDLLCAAANVKA